jgi:sugar lactone lactonase YvrE
VAAAALAAAALGGACEGPPATDCASGLVCTWAGTGQAAFDGDGRGRLDTSLYLPLDLEFDRGPAGGRAYIVDWNNGRIRSVDDATGFQTVLGTDEIGDGPDTGDELTPPGVLGTTININHPTDLAFASDGRLFIASWHNYKVRTCDPSSDLCMVEAGSSQGFAGDGGPAMGAMFNRPKSIVIDPGSGDLFLIDSNNLRVRRIHLEASPPTIETVAGTGERGFAGDGGPPLAAEFDFQLMGDNPEPGGSVTIDGQGRLYVLDTYNQRVRRIDFARQLVETVAGNGTPGFAGDGGPATDASLNYPRDIELGPDGNLYIADTDNHRVRVVDLGTGVISTLAGTGDAGFGGDGGPPLGATFHRPFGIAFDGLGNLYVADTFNNRIRRITR